MFSKKDYDYSKKSRFEHTQNLAQLDHAERCGVRLTMRQIEDNRKLKIIQHAVDLLQRVFASKSFDERVGTWQDFRSWVNTHRLEVRYSHLKKMIVTWKNKTILREVA